MVGWWLGSRMGCLFRAEGERGEGRGVRGEEELDPGWGRRDDGGGLAGVRGRLDPGWGRRDDGVIGGVRERRAGLRRRPYE